MICSERSSKRKDSEDEKAGVQGLCGRFLRMKGGESGNNLILYIWSQHLLKRCNYSIIKANKSQQGIEGKDGLLKTGSEGIWQGKNR